MLLDNYKKQSPIVGVAGLGGGINSYIFLSSGGDYVISKSLRFNPGDSPSLTRTPSSSGNSKKFTISFWAKKSQIGTTYEDLLSCRTGGQFRFIWEPDGNLEAYSNNGGTTTFHIDTIAKFRDPSAWYHFVLSVDAANTSVKFYANGVELTDLTTHTAVQNLDTIVNTATLHTIGKDPSGSHFSGYLADYHLVDGQALAATNFGKFDDDGVWQPKKFSGSYGTNGFHLDFKDTDAIGNDDAGSNNWTANNITAATPGLATADQGMDVVTYTGDGNTRSISSLNFSPDLVWFKNRGTTNYHQLHDRVRGPLKRIYSNVNEGQNDYSTALTSFDSNGWTMGNGTPCNANGNNYVAWCWRAGGAASSNANGSTTTQVSVNQSYGFSISTWTSPSSADTDGWTLGHGLSSAPKFMLVKNISGAGNWTVYHASLGNTKALYLNETSTGQTNQSLWNNTDPTSTVWSAGSTGWYGTSNNFVTYAWSEVAGFSKFGSWTGNSSSNGPTVTLGFKPRFVLFKRSDTSGDSWTIFDTARDSGTLNIGLEPNDNSAEQTYNNRQIVVSDTGFQVTSTGASSNAAGGTYIYAAFASKPNQSALDVLIDSPSQSVADETDTGLGGQITGNYATYNPVRPGSGTKSNGNLTVTGTGQVPDVTSIAPNSGKWYAEIKWDSGTYARIGLQDVNIPTSDFGGVVGQSYRYESNSGNVQPGGQTYSTYAAGDIIGVAFDCDAGKLWLAKNGTWQNSGNPAAGSGAVATNLVSGSYYAPASSSGSGSSVFTLNAGQRAFEYAAPTGFKCLTVENLSTPTIADGSKYFDTKLYAGNGGTQSITMDNSELSPDFVWIKCRNDGIEHQLFDSVRGALKSLRSDNTSAEATVANSLTSFDSNGFSLGSSQGVNHTKNFAAWAWDAGTSTVTNDAGSIDSQVRANPSAGFSIATWTGNGSANQSIGHGLNNAPKFFIQKRLDSTSDWGVTTNASGTQQFIVLNSTAAGQNSSAQASTSSVVYISGSGAGLNVSGGNYVTYCFSPIAGYSAMGSYVGNGDADGRFIYTGFTPSWLLFKRTDSTSDWSIYDTARDPHNVAGDKLEPNTTDAESEQGTVIDILSNGFKFRRNSLENGGNDVYLYMAFASHPFKTARAR